MVRETKETKIIEKDFILITVRSGLSDWWIGVKREDCCGVKVVDFCFGALFIKMREHDSPLY
jgi:hypothetical protein